MMNQKLRIQIGPGVYRLSLIILFILLLFPMAQAKEGFSGKVYYDWSYDNSADSKGYNEFSVSRMYLTFERKINDQMKIKLTTDVISPKSDNARFIYQKYAYLQWTNTLGDMIFGLQGMNVFNLTEKNWGYRYVRKSSMDYHKFASSADIGIGYKTSFMDDFHLHVTVTNGSGYKKLEHDKYKKMAVQLAYGVLDLNKKTGYNAGFVAVSEPYDYGVTETSSGEVKSKTVLAFFAGFRNDAFRLVGEFDQKNDAGSDKIEQIVAVSADYGLTKTMKVFGNYESYHPDTNSELDPETQIIGGLEYRAGKGFYIAPNVRFLSEDSGDIGLSSLVLNFKMQF